MVLAIASLASIRFFLDIYRYRWVIFIVFAALLTEIISSSDYYGRFFYSSEQWTEKSVEKNFR